MSHSRYSAPLAFIDNEIDVIKVARAFAVDDAASSPELTNLLLLNIATSLLAIAEHLDPRDI